MSNKFWRDGRAVPLEIIPFRLLAAEELNMPLNANVELESDDGIFMSAKPVKRPEERNFIAGLVVSGEGMPYWPHFAAAKTNSPK